MRNVGRSWAALPLVALALAGCGGEQTPGAMEQTAGVMRTSDTPVNEELPRGYSQPAVMPLPDARVWGSTAGVDAAKGRDDIWAIDRCASNGCVDTPDVDPLLHYDADGNLIGQMGAGLFAFPHGIHVDRDGNVWVTDPAAARWSRCGWHRWAAGHEA